ncbi:hypothetical protein EZS27_019919 [termite gut metagenome]|uniref:Glycosyl-hydrolase family 116 catalytic region domain-containing protein n=1 Tax=termite gut metagenome TaxID=433724 RepID=A0A5J4RBN8_9ZZZZ
MKSISRRHFIRLSGVAAVGLTLNPGLAMNKAFVPESALKPLYKKLDGAWIQALYEQGKPTVYAKSRNELRYIGMPVGGINAGGVYLGGDGRLWLWDIFNDNREGIEPKMVEWSHQTTHSSYVRSRDGACYIEPAHDIRPLEQGFAFRFEYNGRTIIKYLKASDWDEILFEAGYPVGIVRYIDNSLPVEITLHAYSPFIPLNEDDSGLPASILSFSFKNTGNAAVRITVLGWLENKTGIRSVNEIRGAFGTTVNRRHNKVVRQNNWVAVDETLVSLDKAEEMKNQPDFGTLCVAALNTDAKGYASIDPYNSAELFAQTTIDETEKPAQEPLIGAVETGLNLNAGASAEADFVISWYFPNLKIHEKIKDTGRYYQNRFASALEVAQYIQKDFKRLSSQTLLWAGTWQDSTLPHWFLERTLMNIDTLATTTCHRFSSGRFWAWEGVGACHGTCTHVWQYAQAMGRIFPALERDCRERTDLGIALQPDGGIIFRAEMESRPAIDGQAGSVLRCYREHQMSADDAFLRRNWDNIKKATRFIINKDRNGDGMEDTPLENTLDAVWDGEIAWIVGLCIAAVKAGQRMAEEMGDDAFAAICAAYVGKGSANMDKYLFNGEYYIHRPDKEKGRAKLGSYNTCHIDQVMGQSWAYQVGLGQILDNKNVKSALKSLWKYNYTTDVGPYIETHPGGRPYAVAGEGGLIINTNPMNEEKPYGENVTWQMGYFHECQSGYEYEVAAHMIAEGMTDEGLILVRSIHDRYHGAKRNPYNEIECSDHYARAMASYGAFITACGFEYHGPKGYMRFAPKWNVENFKAPFTAAEGWGSYSQKQSTDSIECALTPRYGQVQLSSFSVEAPQGRSVKTAAVTLGGQTIPAKLKQEGSKLLVTLQSRITVKSDETLNLLFK